MACYYLEDLGEPRAASFFEDQAEVEGEHGKQFLRYRRGRESELCLPVSQRPEVGNRGTGKQALVCSGEQVTQAPAGLKTNAAANNDSDLLPFVGKRLGEQSTNHLGRSVDVVRHRRRKTRFKSRLKCQVNRPHIRRQQHKSSQYRRSPNQPLQNLNLPHLTEDCFPSWVCAQTNLVLH